MVYPGGNNQRRPWHSHMDMYRKIPVDLMDGTRTGSFLSYISLLLMIVLFGWESHAFFYQTKIVTDLTLDYQRDPGVHNNNNNKGGSNNNSNNKNNIDRSSKAFTDMNTVDRRLLELANDRERDQLRLNFNITMTDLSCDYAVIDVVSVLGTDQNVTASITKWNIDNSLFRKGYKGRNRSQKDIELYDVGIDESLEELHEDGVDAKAVDPDQLEELKTNYDYVFVDFFAGWCSHCMDLAPTWEALAEVMQEASTTIVDDEQEKERQEKRKRREAIHPYSDEDYDHAVKVTLPVVVVKVDCVDHKYLCNRQEQIRAYPTLRLFIDGQPWEGGSDYKGHRTVMEMVDWLKHMEEQHKTKMEALGETENDSIRTLHTAHEAAKEYMGVDSDYKNKNANKYTRDNTQNSKLGPIYNNWKDDETIVARGCQLSGHLLLDRVPGNFHILARSKHHDLEPAMTNVSHIVNSLSIGHPASQRNFKYTPLNTNGTINSVIPNEVRSKLSPMDGNVYTTEHLHESYHHYLKVVTTRSKDANLYQILPNTQLSYYTNDMVPEAKFVYDLSPISVTYRMESRRWYEYVTSLFAIIGGIFTIVGMIESTIHSAVSSSTKRKSRTTGAGGTAPGSAQNRYR